jgi:RimJ/RimL family protein N-acetyltransferase
MDMPVMAVEPVTLSGKLIRLEPLAETHIPDLDYACKDPPDNRRTIWRYLLDSRTYRSGGMEAVVGELIRRRRDGTDFAFAIIDLKSGHACGTTRFMEIQPENRVVEIGTWIGLDFQREGVNLESKYLMLRHAFGPLNAMRVQFKIDSRNFASIDAIERIRAVKEGIARNHIILHDGTPRSSVIYSILDTEWPAVEVHLETLMARAGR